ncbi:MAG: hypothetical protein AAFO95_07665 [Cyanobacteria bacterium J06600_6]
MFKYIPRLLGVLILISISSKAHAQTVENNVTSESQPNQEQTLDNDQNNAAAINQTGIYNIGDSATYKIQGLGGRNVVCPRPSFIVGSGFNSTDGINFEENSSYAFNASFIVPLGGELGKTCEGMATTISRKTQYDLEIINARSCAELLNAGIQLKAGNFPTLAEVCEGVSIGNQQASSPQRQVSSPRTQEKTQLPTLPSLPQNNEVNSKPTQLRSEILDNDLNEKSAKKSEPSQLSALPSSPQKHEVKSEPSQLSTLPSSPQKDEINSKPKQLTIVSLDDDLNEYIALDPENVQLTKLTRLVLLEEDSNYISSDSDSDSDQEN